MAQFKMFERSITIFWNGEGGERAARLAARAADARILAAHPIGDWTWSDAGAFLGDLIFIEVREDGGPALDRWLGEAAQVAEAQRSALIVSASSATLDLVAAAVGDAKDATILGNASEQERVVALALAAPPLRRAFADIGNPGDGLRLQRLADEVGRIARTLSDIAGTESNPGSAFGDGLIGYRAQPPRPSSEGGIFTSDVRGIIRLRRMREQFFHGELFADPAWDMMLDLMAARLEGVRVAVSSLCIAAAVPPTTALRWIKTMTDAGLFVRVPDPADARRVFIELSENAAEAMTRYLAAAKGSGALAI